MSKEDYEIFGILKTEKQEEGRHNRQHAEDDFKEAAILASRNGLRLTKCDGGVRYRLEKPKIWIKDIYPGNGRVYCPNPQKKGPYLQLPLMWKLIDVVKAVLSTEQENGKN